MKYGAWGKMESHKGKGTDRDPKKGKVRHRNRPRTCYVIEIVLGGPILFKKAFLKEKCREA